VYNWVDWSGFEQGVIWLLLALWVAALLIYGKLSHLVRLKEIELRKNGILEKDE
jgi:hypothetical protein